MLSENNITQGYFFVLEGPDGSGKTTQMSLLKEALLARGFDVVVAREPGGTKWGQKIREIFFEAQGELAPMAEVMLLLAAKAQVLKEVIYPAFNSGKIVLMDRYTDSLLAYQGHGRMLGRDILSNTVRAAELNFTPNMTLYMDTPFEVCAARLKARAADECSTIDNLEDAYHHRVHQGYREIVADAEANMVPHYVVDGTLTIEQIHEQICGALGVYLNPILPALAPETAQN